ncbi:AraC family transcriptional regulator [Pseudomaricurvus alkylphenolicus]|uniref:AraC family transcriptional regulator ligand-binding domain-containing protein n=1 Tax=Pseudomaricurvus alkylphenolicus TaxID=1306991 RepID=UPI00141EFCD2|nr:AraC family transcriptional regulator [Pseudomaricurvus alkylphenolicus]
MKNPEKLTVVATYGLAIANAIESYGFSSQPLFDEQGLDSRLSFDPNAHHPAVKVFALLRRAVEITGDDAFGLRIPPFLPTTFLPSMGMLFASSENLLRAFEAMCLYQRLVSDVMEYKMTCAGELVFIECEISQSIEKQLLSDVDQHSLAVAFDAAIAGMVGNVCNALDPKFRVKCVYFKHHKPVNFQAFDDLFQAPIRYSQDCYKLEFDYNVLTQPLVTCNPALAKISEQILKHSLENAEKDKIISEIQLQIIHNINRGEPSQEEIAKSMNLSARQLRRKLQQSGTSYARLLQDARHELAKKYLLQANLTVCDIAQLLRFHDQSNFSSAFKRWEGCSPSTYRKQQLLH